MDTVYRLNAPLSRIPLLGRDATGDGPALNRQSLARFAGEV